MPRKKKKKQSQEEVLNDFLLQFTDLTMIEAEGKYSLVKKIMERKVETPASKYSGTKFIYYDNGKEWNSGVLKTTLTINSTFGQCAFVLDFYPDRKVVIVSYRPSVSDMYANPDISCLSRWCQANGWNVPQPIDSLVQGNLPFWKHMWNTLIIDSDMLDEKFGNRKSLDMRAMNDLEDREQDNDGEEI